MAICRGGLPRTFVFGAVVGSVLDGFHTWGGATSYPSPVVLRMAWWTPLLFGGAYTLLGATYGLLSRGSTPPQDKARLGFLVFGALYFASGFLPAPNFVKLLVLLGGAAALWFLEGKSRAALLTGAIAAVLGPSTEIVLVHLGAFRHLGPDAFGIPMWLPGLYLAAGPGAGPFCASLLRAPPTQARADAARA